VFAYRVFPYSRAATSPEEPGHPLYEPKPQEYGRIDHPDYYVWYLAREPDAAVGEVFGNFSEWHESIFRSRGRPMALATYTLPDDLRLLDLDEPHELASRDLRPTRIISRNRPVSQEWGHRIWSEQSPHKGRQWQAVQWWSYYQPTWRVVASWERPEFQHSDLLNLDHFAVKAAATALRRPLKTQSPPSARSARPPGRRKSGKLVG
jgi:RES domain